MKTDNLEKYLNSFGKQVVNRAKGGLQKAKGGGSDLEKSIRFEIIKDNDGFTVQFFMSSYGTFVDKGVSGTQTKRRYKNYENKVVSSPYKYTNKQPPPGIIGRSIKKKGIQGISFFQKPLMLGMKQFGKAMLGALKEDIIAGITTVK